MNRFPYQKRFESPPLVCKAASYGQQASKAICLAAFMAIRFFYCFEAAMAANPTVQGTIDPEQANAIQMVLAKAVAASQGRARRTLKLLRCPQQAV